MGNYDNPIFVVEIGLAAEMYIINSIEYDNWSKCTPVGDKQFEYFIHVGPEKGNKKCLLYPMDFRRL